MSWLALVGPLLYAIALILAPGLLISLAAGRRGFAAAALAPVLSLTALGVGAIIGDLADVAWNWWTPTVAAVVLAGFAWGVRLLLRRWVVAPDTGASLLAQWPLWAAALLAATLWLRHLRNVFDRPDAFSQTFDNIFHLSLVRLFAQTGTGSSMANGGLSPGSGSWFYPAAFHDIASLVLVAFPDSVSVAVSAAVWAIVAVAWPLGALYLIHTLVKTSPLTTIGVGVLTASIPAFPLLLVMFGVLYPNLLGLVLLPPMLALTVEALGLGRSQRYDILALVVGGLAMPGFFLAHPSALMSLLAVASPILLARAWREWRSLRAGDIPRTPAVIRIAIMLACLPFFAFLWTVARPSEGPWPPPMNRTSAFGQALLNAPLGNGPAWAVSVLVVVGLVAAWRRRQGWLIGAWTVALVLWIAAASGPAGPIRDWLVLVYYNDPFRLAAVLGVMALPMAALGLDAVVRWAITHLRSRRPRSNPRTPDALVGVLAVAMLLATTQRVPYMNDAVAKASEVYDLTDTSPLITLDEYTLIQRVPDYVEPGVTVATNPWTGASLLFAFTGVPTTTKHVFVDPIPELTLLNEHLRDAATRPDVCSAAARLGVGYVLDFGLQEVHGASHPLPGLENLATATGFDLVDREGEAALYRITACR